MLPPLSMLRGQLEEMIDCRARQGHDVQGFRDRLTRTPDSYDAFAAFAGDLASAPLRADWPYVEPNGLDDIWAECDSARPQGVIGDITPDEAARKVEAAFLAAVCGCILGKPLEVRPTLEEIRAAAQAVGEWPLHDYISEDMLEALGRRHRSWPETVRGRIQYVAPDDDLNYDIIGMLLLEANGKDFTRRNVMDVWLHNLPALWVHGPERTLLIKAAMQTKSPEQEIPFEQWVNEWNPGSELCGAAIRVDAYGYACPGRPALAAELAWRDASFTHRRTGVYGAMFIAAAIASAFVLDDRLGIFETALQFVPQRSRFYEITADCLAEVASADDWLDGYARIHARYGQYGHCRLYQEVGTLINTMRFASDVDDGICMQVAQGNDTDCFGEIIGSLLGAYLGPGHLSARWLAPFNDEIRTSLAGFYERSLSAVAARMARLPGLIEFKEDAQ